MITQAPTRPAPIRSDRSALAEIAPARRGGLLRGTPRLVWACLAVIALFATCALAAPLLAPHDPNEQSLRVRLHPPLGFGGSAEHPLGTDPLGRDLLSRLIYSTRVSLTIGLAGMVIGLVAGTVCGLLAGFARGPLDDALMFLVDVKLAVPYLVIMFAGIALLGRGVAVLVLFAGFSGWGLYTRMARGMALKLREQPYVQAARALGAGNTRILFRHVLPNAVAPLVVLATLNLTEVIFLESSLSFLGVGVRPPTASWGAMVADGRDYLHSSWWVGVLPGACIMLLTMAISLTGDRLRDMLDPTLKGSGE